LVIIYFGGNDSSFPDPSGFGTSVPLEEYVENMKKIINHIKVLTIFIFHPFLVILLTAKL